MPNWNQILNEVNSSGSTHDVLRRKYLKNLELITGRNTIIYYSGWLQKQGFPALSVNDEDKNGFMSMIHELDRSRGLDLVLHTPGGEVAATESLVDYLRAMFNTDIRAIVPQLAMSAGTMIACACKEIVMGKESSLGPIDPQFGGIPAHGVVEEFKRAVAEVKADPDKIPIWQPILAQYSPTFIGECEKAITWSNEMVEEWLRTGMLSHLKNPTPRVNRILNELSDHALTKSHARHLSIQKCRDIGLKVIPLERNQAFQDAVLSLHHTAMLTLSQTGALKIIENHNGVTFVKMAPQVVMRGQ